MFAQVTCGACKQVVKADEKFFGKTAKCPKCQSHLKIPDPRAQAGADAPPADPLIGKTLAYYQVEALLGQGGMGKVYRARNSKLNKTCALKVLPEQFAQQDKSRIDRFIREAQSAANVEHTNVLPVWNVGNEGDTYFIEMQFVDGGTLDGVLEQKGRLEINEATRIVRDVAAGLAAAHAKSIIHRDMKPSNVMLTKDGQVKVADFGLAKMGEASTKLTMSGMILGTPLYMSPEQCEGKPVDHRSDVYSLGVMFYQLLTGTPPYTADTPHAMLYQHINTPLPDINQVVADVPPVLAAILSRMTAKKVEDRYQSCAELCSDLNAFLASSAAPVGLSESTMLKAQELKSAIRGKEKKRSMAPLLVGVIPTLIVVGVLAFVLVPKWKRQMEQPVEPPVEKVVKKTYMYKGTEYTAEQLLAVGIDPKTGKPVDEEKSEGKSEGKPSAPSAGGAEEKKETTDRHRLTQMGKEEKTEDRSQKSEGKKEEKESAESAKSADQPDQSQTANRESAVDLVAFLDDIKPVNELVDKRDYAAARGRANLLKTKYPELIETKLANIDRIEALRKKCIDRVNSGAAKVSMGDISKRYAFAGEIKKVDDKQISAKIAKKWDDLDRDEIVEFYRKASDPKSPEDLMGIAAFLMEGAVEEKGLDTALNPLGKASGIGADVSALTSYVDALKRAQTEHAEAEAKGKGAEAADSAKPAQVVEKPAPEGKEAPQAVPALQQVKAIVVRQDGKGDYRTIREAVAAVEDGGIIIIDDQETYREGEVINCGSKRNVLLTGRPEQGKIPRIVIDENTKSWVQLGKNRCAIFMRGERWEFRHLLLDIAVPRAADREPYAMYYIGSATIRSCALVASVSVPAADRPSAIVSDGRGGGAWDVENSLFCHVQLPLTVRSCGCEARLRFSGNTVVDGSGTVSCNDPDCVKVEAVGNVLWRVLVPWRDTRENAPAGQVEGHWTCDRNCYFMPGSIYGYQPRYVLAPRERQAYEIKTLKEWQAKTGNGKNSIEANPMFRNVEKMDFRLSPRSPCRKRGLDGKDMGVDWEEFYRWEDPRTTPRRPPETAKAEPTQLPPAPDKEKAESETGGGADAQAGQGEDAAKSGPKEAKKKTRKPKPPKTLIAKCGELVFQDDFERDDIAPWTPLTVGTVRCSKGCLVVDATGLTNAHASAPYEHGDFVAEIALRCRGNSFCVVINQPEPKGQIGFGWSPSALLLRGGDGSAVLSQEECPRPFSSLTEFVLEKVGRKMFLRFGRTVLKTEDADLHSCKEKGTYWRVACRNGSVLEIDHIYIWKAEPGTDERSDAAPGGKESAAKSGQKEAKKKTKKVKLPPTLVSECGELLFEDDFDEKELTGWVPMGGTPQVSRGSLLLDARAQTSASMRRPMAAPNFVIEVSVAKIIGAPTLQCWVCETSTPSRRVELSVSTKVMILKGGVVEAMNPPVLGTKTCGDLPRCVLVLEACGKQVALRMNKTYMTAECPDPLQSPYALILCVTKGAVVIDSIRVWEAEPKKGK